MIEYNAHSLSIDGVAASALVERFGTPLYVYSQEQIEANCCRYNDVSTNLDLSLHYAVKANHSTVLLQLIQQQGFGFDIVSGGELLRCCKAGIDPKNIVYSGVGKSVEEIKLALNKNVGCINIESFAELERVQQLASEAGVCAPIAFRLNPHIDANTHPSISTALADSKFGIDHHRALEVCHKAAAMDAVQLTGIVCHLGSQIQTLDPYDQACDSLISIYDTLKEQGIVLEHIGLGGGLGIVYKEGEISPDPSHLIALVESRLQSRRLRLSLEPGRSIVGNAGVVISRIEYLKHDHINFAIIDAAMNDVPRPAVYGAWHRIEEVEKNSSAARQSYNVVGPVCESTDELGKNRQLAVEPGDLVAIFDTGAYTSVMASNYNCRPIAASVLIAHGQAQLISARQGITELPD